MIIDWYTVIFQIINFLILVFLLRYFLYGPIIRAMDQREQKIVEREEEAARQKKEAGEEAESYRRKSGELEQREEEIIEEARAAAEKEKRELLNEARREVDRNRRRWEEAFEREKESFITELRRRIASQACSIARRCLEDLADARLETLAWDLFLEKIRALPAEERSTLLEALEKGNHRVTLSSAFDLPAGKSEKLQEILEGLLPDPDGAVELKTKKDPALICGLELEAGGYRLAWNVDGYLEGIEEQILKDLDQSAPQEEAGEVSADDGEE